MTTLRPTRVSLIYEPPNHALSEPDPRTLVAVRTSLGRVAELGSLSTVKCAPGRTVVPRGSMRIGVVDLQNHSLY